MKKLSLLILALLFIPLVSAQIAIKSFDTNLDKVLPGNQIQLALNLENVGDDDIKNVLVKLDLSQVPFAPLKSSSEQVIDEINENDETTIYFNLIALPNAESQIYKIPVKISYDDVEKDSLISIEISAKARLDLLLEESEVVKINDQGKVTVKFVNNGLTQIRFLKVTLQQSPAYEILSSNEIYIGEVDVDDFETEEFTIIPRIKNPQLAFNLEYRDANNNNFMETKFIQLNVYTLEEAKQLGLVKSNFTGLWIIIIIVIVLGIFIYRRIKRKKNVS
jgi:hypothetical protein